MVRLFNATKDTRTPALVGIGCMGLNAAACWLLMQWWSHWGIALATSLVSYVNTLALYAIFRRRYGPLDEAGLGRTLGTHALLAAVIGCGLYWPGRWLAAVPGSLMTPERLAMLAGITLAATGAYLALGWLGGVKEVRTFVRFVTRSGPVSRLVRGRDGR